MKSREIPVLMYHSVSDGEENLYLNVRPNVFQQQMLWLHEERYQTISPDTLTDILSGRKMPAGKQVLITFDDGYASQFDQAAPILNGFAFSATLFVSTGSVGKADFTTVFPAEERPQKDRPLTWDELAILKNRGWSIQAHGCEHKRHAQLAEPALHTEFLQAKTALEEHLANTPAYYAYPYGSYSETVLHTLERAGYRGGFSVHPGLATPGDDLRRIHRIEINGNDTLPTFIRKVQTGYGSMQQRILSALRDRLFRNARRKDRLSALGRKFIN